MDVCQRPRVALQVLDEDGLQIHWPMLRVLGPHRRSIAHASRRCAPRTTPLARRSCWACRSSRCHSCLSGSPNRCCSRGCTACLAASGHTRTIWLPWGTCQHNLCPLCTTSALEAGPLHRHLAAAAWSRRMRCLHLAVVWSRPAPVQRRAGAWCLRRPAHPSPRRVWARSTAATADIERPATGRAWNRALAVVAELVGRAIGVLYAGSAGLHVRSAGVCPSAAVGAAAVRLCWVLGLGCLNRAAGRRDTQTKGTARKLRPDCSGPPHRASLVGAWFTIAAAARPHNFLDTPRDGIRSYASPRANFFHFSTAIRAKVSSRQSP